MKELVANSGRHAQQLLADAVVHVKKADRLSPITLLVDGNHQAIQFRRQLISQVARISDIKALIGIQAFTKIEFLEELTRIHGSSWNFDSYKGCRNQVIQELIAAETGALRRFASSLQDLQALFAYFDLFDWLNPSTFREPEGQTTKLALDLIDLVTRVHKRLENTEHPPVAILLKKLKEVQDASISDRLATTFGSVFRIAEQFPQILMDYLESSISKEALYVLEIGRPAPDDAKTKSTLVCAPDPFTEAKGVVDLIAGCLASGISTNRIAVLYSDAAEYSQPLAQALDDADIHWHGFDIEEPRASGTARALTALLRTFNSFVADKDVSRAQFLQLVRTSRFDPANFDFDNFAADRFIRSNSFYGGISTWLPLLDSMFSDLEQRMAQEEEELKYGEEESQKSARRAVEESQTAGTLANIIRFLFEYFGKMATEKDLASLGAGLADLFSKLFSDRAFPRTQSDALVADKAIASLRSCPSLTGSPLELSEQLLSTIDSLMSRLKLQRGEMSRGVYVGPVSQNGGLEFDVVFVLGCSEGIFPPKIKQHPLLPDSIKISNESYSRELANIQGRIDQIERHFKAITRDAKQVHLSYARGGFIGASSGEPSRFLRDFAITQERKVLGTKSFRLLAPEPVSNYSTMTRAILLNKSARDQKTSKTTSAALAFARPTLGVYFGTVDVDVAGEVFDFETANLSASSVEKFLACNQSFFVTKVLGFPDQDEPDEILDVRPLDIGNIVHHAFERLLKEHPTLNPKHGQPYSVEARQKFVDLIKDEAEKTKSKGLAGWLPRFNDTIGKYVSSVDTIFELEHQTRANPGGVKGVPRASDSLAPSQAEFGWHQYAASPHLVKVENSNGRTVNMRFVGYIDRLNSSEGGSTLGVLDFKTGEVKKSKATPRVQDLLYASAIRAKSPFLGVPVSKVSSLYLVLKPGAMSIVNLRTDLLKGLEGIWLDPSDGGLTGVDFTNAVQKASDLLEVELRENLALLADAVDTGKFYQTDYQFCPCCSLLGKRVLGRLSAQLKAEFEVEDD